MTKHNDGIARTLITFTVPLILSGLLQQLYNWADAFIVGNIVGEGALAAVGATNAITGLFVMAITGLNSGSIKKAARPATESAHNTAMTTSSLACGLRPSNTRKNGNIHSRSTIMETSPYCCFVR